MHEMSHVNFLVLKEFSSGNKYCVISEVFPQLKQGITGTAVICNLMILLADCNTIIV